MQIAKGDSFKCDGTLLPEPLCEAPFFLLGYKIKLFLLLAFVALAEIGEGFFKELENALGCAVKVVVCLVGDLGLIDMGFKLIAEGRLLGEQRIKHSVLAEKVLKVMGTEFIVHYLLLLGLALALDDLGVVSLDLLSLLLGEPLCKLVYRLPYLGITVEHVARFVDDKLVKGLCLGGLYLAC